MMSFNISGPYFWSGIAHPGPTLLPPMEGISVIYFPKDATTRKKWIEQVKRTRDGWKGTTGSSVVCSEHFSKDSFAERNLRSSSLGIIWLCKLKKDAVPKEKTM